jgi:predicted nucleic acid-binding protein
VGRSRADWRTCEINSDRTRSGAWWKRCRVEDLLDTGNGLSKVDKWRKDLGQLALEPGIERRCGGSKATISLPGVLAFQVYRGYRSLGSLDDCHHVEVLLQGAARFGHLRSAERVPAERSTLILGAWDQRPAERHSLAPLGYLRIDPLTHRLRRLPFRRLREVDAVDLLKSVKIPDLLIAATAERAGLTLVHYDQDCETIESVTGQSMRWVAERGTL